MIINTIPIISVSYNSEELISDLLGSLRIFYSNPVTIIDGSDEDKYKAIQEVCASYEKVNFIHFDYNIHHGPGMAWAIQNLNLTGPVLVLDSDISILKNGFIEDLNSNLTPDMYGIGYIAYVNEDGFDVDYVENAIPYLHPACMLVNIDVVKKWPMPTKHGAPLIEPMLALHREGKSNMIKDLAWVKNDFRAKSTGAERHYLRHDWQGTVLRNGSYNLDEWSKEAAEAAQTRQILINNLPLGNGAIVEIGNNNGMLSRACSEFFPGRPYLSIGGHLDKIAKNSNENTDIGKIEDDIFREWSGAECWIFDEAIEQLEAPEELLKRLRKYISLNASVLAVIPNAQHWSLQVRLLGGDLKYSNRGLLSVKQRRFFSRNSIFELFKATGYEIGQCTPVIDNELKNKNIESAMKYLIATLGIDTESGFQNAQIDSYIVRAHPV